MIDREKVIKGLGCCIALQDSPRDGYADCECCPYNDDPFSEGTCESIGPLLEDALALLKEQEPRVLTLEEATGDDECWLETKAGANGYADVYMCSGHQCVEAWRCSSKKADYLPFSTYEKLWRCWSSRPTKEQMKATPWRS